MKPRKPRIKVYTQIGDNGVNTSCYTYKGGRTVRCVLSTELRDGDFWRYKIWTNCAVIMGEANELSVWYSGNDPEQARNVWCSLVW